MHLDFERKCQKFQTWYIYVQLSLSEYIFKNQWNNGNLNQCCLIFYSLDLISQPFFSPELEYSVYFLIFERKTSIKVYFLITSKLVFAENIFWPVFTATDLQRAYLIHFQEEQTTFLNEFKEDKEKSTIKWKN